MKNIFCLFFFSITLINYAQKNTTLKTQKLAYNEAERYLKNKNPEKAAEFFRYTNKLDVTSKIGVAAIRKYDSIMKSEVLKPILGKWVLFESGSNWGFTQEKDSISKKVLVITNDEFQFYNENFKTKERKEIKIEKIIFTKYEDMSGLRLDFVFNDKSLWNFFLDKERNILKQFYTGEETNNGRTEMVCGNSELKYKRYDEVINLIDK